MEQMNAFLTFLESIIVYVWAVFAIIMIILEVSFTGVLQIWFAIGAIAAAVVAWFFPGSLLLQLGVFLGVSCVLLLIGSRFFKNEDNNDSKSHNRVYSILGKTATVTKEINTIAGEGQISVGGDKWSAKTKGEDVIPENTKVKVVDIDGVKAVVEIINE